MFVHHLRQLCTYITTMVKKIILPSPVLSEVPSLSLSGQHLHVSVVHTPGSERGMSLLPSSNKTYNISLHYNFF